MSIPNINVLKKALSVFKKQEFSYISFGTNSIDAAGRIVKGAPTSTLIKGHVNAIRRKAYKDMGLELSEKYKMFFGCFDFEGINRDSSAGHIEYNGRKYEIKDTGDWMYINGWDYAVGVDVGAI